MPSLHKRFALQDFRRARHKADLATIVSFLREQPLSVFAHPDLYEQARSRQAARRECRAIPIDAITGGISHYDDFRRTFLPQNAQSGEQLAAIALMMNTDTRLLPPVEVYQIAESYFVHDGNHRVLIARQLGAKMIESVVTPIETPQDITWANEPQQIIIHAEALEFFRQTSLERRRSPEHLTVTVPGKFHILYEQIAVCQIMLSREQQQDVSFKDAARYWYDQIYVPAIRLIEGLETLRDFPERTTTDLYIWVSEHRDILAQPAALPDMPMMVKQATALSEAIDAQLQAEHDDFLRRTQLNQSRPDAEFRFTQPGQYRILDNHIQGHRYFMGLEHRRDISPQEAALHWHDAVYLPITQAIKAQHLLDDFPACTITELYIWISAHQILSREMSLKQVEMYLPEIWARLKNFPYDDFDELRIKIEYIDFLLRTHLHDMRPNADLTVSVPGQYRILEEHIDTHRYFMGLEQHREIPYRDAVEHWHDAVYLPVVNLAKERRLFRNFPALTTTDMYLWIAEYRAQLERQAGSLLPLETVINGLVTRFGAQKSVPGSRLNTPLFEEIAAESVLRPPSSRLEIADRRSDHLIATILVPFQGRKDGWTAVEQALDIARLEEAHILAVQVVPSPHQRDSDSVFTIKSQFEQRCQAAQVHGEFRVVVGEIARKTADYARQVELVIFAEATAASANEALSALRRLGSAPLLLLLPSRSISRRRVLLLYDGSAISNEGLFASAYAATRWGCDLMIATTARTADLREFLAQYLTRRDIAADVIDCAGQPPESLPKFAREHGVDVVVAGRHEASALIGHITAAPSATLPFPLLVC